MKYLLSTLFLVFSLCLITTSLQAQETSFDYEVMKTKAIKVGTTKKVSESLKVPKTSAEVKKAWKEVNRPPKDMKNRGTRHIVKPELEHQGPDPVRQSSSQFLSMNQNIKVLQNFDGLTNGSPNDPTGDIGKDYYVEAINATQIGVFDKDGMMIDQFSANTLWQPLGFFSAGDPIVLYDQEYEKWIITEFPSGNQLLIAVSETSDPLGAYDVYNFSTPNFPDYPKYAVWQNALTVTTNEQGPGILHIYMLNREQIMNGEDNVDIQRIGIEGNTAIESGFFVATPVDWTGQAKPDENQGPYFLSLDDSAWGVSDEDQINLWEIDIDWDDENNTEVTKTSIVTAPYDTYPCSVSGIGWSCIPQPDGAVGLDGLPDVIMNQSHYRKFPGHESIVLSFVTDVTDGENLAGVRWMELRKSGADDWSLYQEGTYAPDDGLDRFMSSICMDKFGNIALAYNVSSEEEYPGIRMTARRAGDPLGMMTFTEEIVVEGTNTVEAFARFGDYAHMTIDPIDDVTFWHISEYGGDGFSNSNVRIVSFILEKENYDLAVTDISSPETNVLFSSEPEDVTATITNFGKNPIEVFDVGYIFEGTPSAIENVEFLLEPDSNYTHTFADQIITDQVGYYDLEVFVTAEMDSTNLNDTLKLDVRKLGNVDAATYTVENASGLAFVCDQEITFNFEISNQGVENLTSVDYSVLENGNEIGADSWEGDLATFESEFVSFTTTSITNGDNEYTVILTNPNGQNDEDLSNNTSSTNIEVDLEASTVNLTITFDFFADQTSWDITNEDGEVMAEGNNYTISNATITETICLPDDQCYNLNVYDSAGNGVFAGTVVVEDEDEQEIVIDESLQQIGASESFPFCLGAGCILDIDVTVTPSGTDEANTGIISISVNSGFPPFQYSINDGETFGSTKVFENLDDGFYDVVVQDSFGCIIDTFAIIDIVAIKNQAVNSNNITIAPNPNNGFFSMEIEYDGPYMMNYTIINEKGQFITKNSINRYNDTYLGQVNLTSFPSGIYYIVFDNKNAGVAKVIVQ